MKKEKRQKRKQKIKTMHYNYSIGTKAIAHILYHVAAIFTRLMLYDYDVSWSMMILDARAHLQDRHPLLKLATTTTASEL